MKNSFSQIKKYLSPRNYIEHFKWLPLFRRTSNSIIDRNVKIHSSSEIKHSRISKNTLINKNVTIHSCHIGEECKLMANSYFYNSSIGDYSYVNMYSFILRAKVGKFCSIASHVYIGPGSHPIDFVTTHPMTFLKDYGNFITADDKEIVNKREIQSVKIGNDVWIGQGVVIMDNIKIGDGAIIAAHAVVTKDVAPFAIVAGVPAKLIRYRFQEEDRNKLLGIKWWDWPTSKIKENIEQFKDLKLFLDKHSIM